MFKKRYLRTQREGISARKVAYIALIINLLKNFRPFFYF